jgi:hypothetical protein
MKTCSKCGEEKPHSEFHLNSTGRDGLKSTCKLCSNAQSAAWRKRNPDRVASNSLAHRVANREKARANSAAWRIANPDKAKESVAEWRKRNPEKAKASAAAYAKKNPEAKKIHHQNRRARKKQSNGRLSKGLAEKLFQLQKGRCVCCGKPLGDDYHMDHITPLLLGGTNTDDNIQLLRAICNMQKHAKDPIDFMRQRGHLL